MILGTLNAVLVVKMTPEGGEIDVRVIYMRLPSLCIYCDGINR